MAQRKGAAVATDHAAAPEVAADISSNESVEAKEVRSHS